jgi:hypothetical protein
MACSNEDRGRSRRPDVENWGWSHRLGTQWLGIERSGGAMCGLHRGHEDEEREFLD